ncbi:hypothetical protein [Sphingobium sp.]|uniref:hypothetical protein n=1 Tax=Sphingobium sp. TaxID=1912891 RepID=UPI0028BD9B9A|nr:hypothetical protein [Sphingobium sp.]
MIYEGEINPYFTAGFIKSKGRVAELILTLPNEYLDELREGGASPLKTSPRLDEFLREQFSEDLAEKLVGKDGMDSFEEDSLSWDDSDEPHHVGAGFFIFAEEIDWEAGTLRTSFIPSPKNREEHLFWDQEEHLPSELDDPDFEVSLSGMCFELTKVEMLLPNERITAVSPMVTARGDQAKSLGRPRKWDWDGAMAHIVMLANKPDGLPTGAGAQARIEEMLQQWFLDQSGDAPALSQIRQRAQKIVGGMG